MSATQVSGVSTPDPPATSTKRPSRLRQILTVIAGATIVVFAYWNIAGDYNATSQMSQRETNDIVMQELRFAPVRAYLQSSRYKGEIGFITDTDLVPARPATDRDGVVWGQTQYVMLPWLLLHGRRDTPFVIASFPDGAPAVHLEGYSTLFELGNGYIFLRRGP